MLGALLAVLVAILTVEGLSLDMIPVVPPFPLSRASFIASFGTSVLLSSSTPLSVLQTVGDPDTYEALLYKPPLAKSLKLLPLLVVLPGAGKNQRGAMADMASPKGEQAGLACALLNSGKAPNSLSDNFVVIQPYPMGKTSFYEEPRARLLSFVDWFLANNKNLVDPEQIHLYGFSDGATVAVEIATTGRFQSVVIAACGLSGTLPPRALELLKAPFWVFHSVDDEVFPVACSDRLVDSLRKSNGGEAVRYSRLEKGAGGHRGAGIAASSDPEVYKWMLSQRRRPS